ncbi:hypothetical protein N574_0118560 [Lactiplantibacillus plantarum 2165]|nr:hypothetical protein N574_0118560 [Lactiplantibacillus plantarum 2165]
MAGKRRKSRRKQTDKVTIICEEGPPSVGQYLISVGGDGGDGLVYSA